MEILGDRLAALEKAVLEMDTRVDALVEEKIGAHTDGLEERLSPLDHRTDGTLERIAATEERILHCVERLEKTEEMIAAMQAEGDRLLAEIAAEGEPEEEKIVTEPEIAAIEEIPVPEPSEEVRPQKTIWEKLLTGRD